MSDVQSIRIEVQHRSGCYPILIEPGLYSAAAEHLAPYARNKRLIVVTDANVWPAQGPRLKIGLAGSGIEVRPIILAPGEQSKSWQVVTRLIDRLLALEVERHGTIVAFGGGVIGDLTGFAASILKRGCNYVQVPTSLLSQVDSSVGGKTGINTRVGKNLVGTFHHPSAVLIDPRALETLPDRHIRAGFAEVLKMGLIADPDFFAWCENKGPALIAGDVQARMHAIATSIAAKAKIVAEDERETNGRRQLLNLGHTFGHALEAETGMGDKLLHGEAVALGMLLAFSLSRQLGHCEAEARDRLGRLLKETGLPTDLKALPIKTTGARLAGNMAHDKKAREGKLPLILARGIGQPFADNSVTRETIAVFLDEQLQLEQA